MNQIFRIDESGLNPLCKAIVDHDIEYINKYYFNSHKNSINLKDALKNIFDDMNSEPFLILNNIDNKSARLVSITAFSELRLMGENNFF